MGMVGKVVDKAVDKTVGKAARAAGDWVSDRIGHFWWVVLSRGILAFLFGLAALFWPHKTLGTVVFLAGGYLVIDGVLGLVQAFGAKDFVASLLQALASIAAGAAALLWTGITTQVLLVVLGVWALVQGAGWLHTGWRLHTKRGRGKLILGVGGLLVVFGVVALVWRDAGAVALIWLVGLVAIAAGILMILGSRRLKGVQERVDSVGERES